MKRLDLPGLLKTKQGVRPKDQMGAAMIAAVSLAEEMNTFVGGQ